ncbi:MAG: 50S ribosomal protein L6, partial [Ignavibacteriae bacterium]|nr:50S ribosomal protein L6 [Ignavibacteriota bacterium]
MSRVGKKPISITKGVSVSRTAQHVIVKGPKGELSADVHDDIGFEIKDNQVVLTRKSEEKVVRSLHGL